MEQKIKLFASAILVAFVVVSMVSVVAAGSGRIYINSEDVTDQFDVNPTDLVGTFTADSSNVRLAEHYAQWYMGHLMDGLDVDLYYNGPGTTRVSITVPVTTD